jgi:hypothetical protein
LCRFFQVPPAYFFPELEHEGVVFQPLASHQREKNPA